MIDMKRMACTLILEFGADESLIMVERGRIIALRDGNAEWECRWAECKLALQDMAGWTMAQVLAAKHDRKSWTDR